MEIEWMITYCSRYGDYWEEDYITYDTKEEALKSLEKRVMNEKTEPTMSHRLYTIIYDRETTESIYELYQDKMSRETQRDIESKAKIKVMSHGWLTGGTPTYYWTERWEYEGDLFSRW